MNEIEKVLNLSSETDIILKIGEIIWGKTTPEDNCFSKLNDIEKTFVYIDLLEGQVHNGGFDQFFFNSSGSYTYGILSSYKKIKANKTAELLETAMKLFPIQPIPTNTAIRRQYMVNVEEFISERWNDLDDEFYKYADNVPELLISFIKEHIREFD